MTLPPPPNRSANLLSARYWMRMALDPAADKRRKERYIQRRLREELRAKEAEHAAKARKVAPRTPRPPKP